MRYLSILLCIVLCLLCLGGCAQGAEDADAILSERMAATALPAGEVYRFRMGENGNAPLDDGRLRVLFGEDAPKACFPLIEEYAIYLSSGAPYEIAVFVCYAESDTDTVAQMCLARTELLRTVLGHTEYHDLVFGAEITVHGRCVILNVT